MKTWIMPCLLLFSPLVLANELNGQDWRTLTWLSQTARIHAHKVCGMQAERQRPACEMEQIKALAESASSLTAYLPPNISSHEFAWMIENRARFGGQAGLYRQGGDVVSQIDCRINVC